MPLAIAVLCIVSQNRQPLLEAMDEAKEDFSIKGDGDRTALVLSLALSCLSLLG